MNTNTESRPSTQLDSRPGGATNPQGAGYRPVIVRAAWALAAGSTVALATAGVAEHYDALLEIGGEYRNALADLGLSDNFYARYVSALGIVVLLAHVLLAAVIIWRRPDDWMALFVSVALVANGAINPFSPMHTLVDTHPAWGPAVNLVAYLAVLSSVSLLYLFPTGRFVPPWTFPLALVWAALSIPAVFFSGSALSHSTWPVTLQAVVLLAWAASGLFAQIYRFAYVSSLLEQQQAKWAVLGLMAAAVGPMAYFFSFDGIASLSGTGMPNILEQRLGSNVFTTLMVVRLVGINLLGFGLLLFPVSFAIAIMRFRLWDIGVFVNRTLVYGALTATIVAAYIISVVLLQLAFDAITDQGSGIAIVVSTLAIAALFQPIRRRVQDFIDRRFYRRKYDAAQTLSAFAATLRSEVDLETLGQELEAVVEQTIQPAHVSLWLRKPGA